MIMDPGLTHAAAVLPGEMHGNGGDIDSLLSGGDTSDGHVGSNSGHGGASHGSTSSSALDGKARRLLEPYERHRAHDLRAECYRRGIRPIKKGPNANDNKNGYIVLLRKYDGTSNGGLDDARANGGGTNNSNHPHPHSEEDADDGDSDSTPMAAALAIKKRKLPTGHLAVVSGNNGSGTLNSAAAVVAANDLAGFYDTSQAPLVPVLPMQYPTLAKPPQVQAQAPPPTANPTTSDLEILSGIANSYTMQMGAALTTTSSSTASTAPTSVAVAAANGVLAPHVSADLCGACRSVVSDQLMESIRLGRNKMQMLEYQRLLELRDKDTMHLKEIVGVLRDLRQSLRDAQKENRLTHELLVELEDDIAFFQALKERTKERMRREMQEARERAAKQNSTNPGGGTT